MKVQIQLLAVVLVLSAQARAMGGVSAEDRRQHLRLVREQGFSQRVAGPLDRAYLDALNALGQQNTCSEFFGGEAAQNVLTELVISLRAMTGEIVAQLTPGARHEHPHQARPAAALSGSHQPR